MPSDIMPELLERLSFAEYNETDDEILEGLERLDDNCRSAGVMGSYWIEVAQHRIWARASESETLKGLLRESMSVTGFYPHCPNQWGDGIGADPSPVCGTCWYCRATAALSETRDGN